MQRKKKRKYLEIKIWTRCEIEKRKDLGVKKRKHIWKFKYRVNEILREGKMKKKKESEGKVSEITEQNM